MGSRHKPKLTTNTYSFTRGRKFEDMLEFVRAAEELGYENIRLIDHVVGVVAELHPELTYAPYTHTDVFHECFTFMAYLAALTKKIRLVSGILVLPQRQTALVAKQAAEVDFLSHGRLILGVGVGYNPVEFRALDATFPDRGARIEEQIEVLRALWTQESVNFKGRWHEMVHVNLNPPPVQRPIPIWMGSGSMKNPVAPERVLERVGRLADGWMPQFRLEDKATRFDDAATQCIKKVKAYGRQAGRDPQSMAIELTLFTRGKSNSRLLEEVEILCDAGATHIHVRPQEATTQDDIRELRRVRDVLAPA